MLASTVERTVHHFRLQRKGNNSVPEPVRAWFTSGMVMAKPAIRSLWHARVRCLDLGPQLASGRSAATVG